MDDGRFDRIARVIATSSRRQLLRGLAGGAVGALLAGLGQEEAAAVCRLEGQRCNRKRRCCRAATCERHGDKNVCVCPESQQFRVQDRDICCPAAKVCGSQSGDDRDDRCCYPDEVCLDNACCCDGCRGSKVCGGTCCPSYSCCGGACCPAEPGNEQVCAKDSRNAPPTCVSADRGCEGVDDCKFAEQCIGRTCCSGIRICPRDELGNPGPNGAKVCCRYGYFCDRSNPAIPAKCCPVNEGCTFRAARFRR